jgi:hypothetical protein
VHANNYTSVAAFESQLIADIFQYELDVLHAGISYRLSELRLCVEMKCYPSFVLFPSYACLFYCSLYIMIVPYIEHFYFEYFLFFFAISALDIHVQLFRGD